MCELNLKKKVFVRVTIVDYLVNLPAICKQLSKMRSFFSLYFCSKCDRTVRYTPIESYWLLRSVFFFKKRKKKSGLVCTLSKQKRSLTSGAFVCYASSSGLMVGCFECVSKFKFNTLHKICTCIRAILDFISMWHVYLRWVVLAAMVQCICKESKRVMLGLFYYVWTLGTGQKFVFFILLSIHKLPFVSRSWIFFSLDLFSAPNGNWLEAWTREKAKLTLQVKNYLPISCTHAFLKRKKKQNMEKIEKIVTPANVMHVDIRDNWTDLKDRMQQKQPKTRMTYRINDTYEHSHTKKCLEKECWCWIDDKHMEIKCVFVVCTLDI